jgi:hypothetical protein
VVVVAARCTVPAEVSLQAMQVQRSVALPLALTVALFSASFTTFCKGDAAVVRSDRRSTDSGETDTRDAQGHGRTPPIPISGITAVQAPN